MISKKIIFYCIILLFLCNCSEKNTENKDEIFELWTSQKAPENISVIKGKYWESAHWSKEYEIFIQIRSDKKWWNEFKNINNLEQYKTNFNEEIENNFYTNPQKRIIEQPNWFIPNKKSEIYIKGSSEYFWDPKSETIFIHELQF